jgi:SAM-dependent methyltransferase
MMIAFFNEKSCAPIIDLRSVEEYVIAHWKNASHFPVESIISRMYELPKRDQQLRLIGKSNQLTIAQNQLLEKGYQIAATIEWTYTLEKRLESLNLLEKGIKSTRLWSPAPIVRYFQNNIVNETNIGRALDIGCGAGRDSVYLATKGWQVDAVDYLPDALSKVITLAKRNHVAVNCHLIDLEKSPDTLKHLDYQYQLIIVSRYLHRPLLPILKKMIASEGYIVYQTFMRGCEAFGSPKNPRFLLEKGELAGIFTEFDVIQDEIEYLEDGRPTNAFIARKK